MFLGVVYPISIRTAFISNHQITLSNDQPTGIISPVFIYSIREYLQPPCVKAFLNFTGRSANNESRHHEPSAIESDEDSHAKFALTKLNATINARSLRQFMYEFSHILYQMPQHLERPAFCSQKKHWVRFLTLNVFLQSSPFCSLMRLP